MQPWSTQYARSLSVEQWVDEIGARFVKAIQQEVNSLPLREPIKSTLAKCGVEPESLSPCLVDWDIYNASVLGETASLTFTDWFFVITRPWHRPQDDEIAVEPVLVDDDESQTILIGFDGILHIDNAGALSESEVVTVYTDPDLMPVLHERDDSDSIFSFHHF